jgi:CO/xanthine dehydrogenase FAD-binding subunit
MLGGTAAAKAALKLRDNMIKCASELFGVPKERINLVNGKAFDKKNSKNMIPINELAEEMYLRGYDPGAHGFFKAPERFFDPETGLGVNYSVYTFAATVAEVEVDTETGEIFVTHIWPAMDCGKAIDPLIIEGQTEGAISQGLGFTLMENIELNDDGQVINPTFTDYVVPSSLDTPEIEPCIIIEKPYKHGVFGAKGVGEPAIISIVPSIVNAIYHATGQRFNTIPIRAWNTIIGGTDLLVAMRQAACSPKHIVDLNRIPELNYIKEEEGFIKIGASTTLNQVASNSLTKKIFSLHDAVSIIGSPQIRNRASITGNIVNASPASDTAGPLIVHEAEIEVKSIDSTNIMPIEELFVGPKINCLEPEELVTEIRIPIPPENSASAFKRIGRRKAFTLSVVSSSVYISNQGKICRDAKFAFGSVDMTPLRIYEIDEFLKGLELSDENILQACERVREYVNPITDLRGTEEYRRDMCPVLMKRAIETCIKRLGGTI